MITDYPRNPPGLVWEPVYCPPRAVPAPEVAPSVVVQVRRVPRRLRPQHRRKIDGMYIRISRMSRKYRVLRVWLSWSILSLFPDIRRIDIYSCDGVLILEPVESGGWAIAPARKRSHARCVICSTAAPLLAGYDGAYRARVEGGRIIVGERL